ncbi:hypothetical protein GGS21DRAFT_549457 [Xylaria nigripes]|nr:hypothetical protein GGS21DRAFT_549457 [Xylaria nigripes]
MLLLAEFSAPKDLTATTYEDIRMKMALTKTFLSHGRSRESSLRYNLIRDPGPSPRYLPLTPPTILYNCLLSISRDRNYFINSENVKPDDDEHQFCNNDLCVENGTDVLGDHTEKHFCLLGEILNGAISNPVTLLCRGVNDRAYTVYIHAHDMDSQKRLFKDMRPGNSLAIFFPFSAFEEDGFTVGIDVLAANVIIFPLPLKEALAMNDEAIQFLKRDTSPRKCHGCGVKPREEALFRLFGRCGACNLFSYCSRDCQLNAWSSHKKFCKVLRVPEVKRMLLMNYGRGPICEGI